VTDHFKKNLGNQIAHKGEEFVEETLKNNHAHPAMNSPKRLDRIRRG